MATEGNPGIRKFGLRGVLLVGLFVIFLVVVSVNFDLFEMLFLVTREVEHHELDEFFVVLMALPAPLSWYFWRRMREMRQAFSSSGADPGPDYSSHHLTQANRDLIGTVLVSTVIGFCLIAGDAFDKLHAFSRAHEEWELDEIILFLLSLSVPLSWYAWRRWQELGRVLTERAKLMEELTIQKSAAEHADRAKTVFLANMSHEIRTPMNAILGMSELIQESGLTPEQAEYARIVSSAGGALMTVINDVLDLAKAESGQVALENAPFDLMELVEDVSLMVGDQARQGGIEFVCRVAPNVPVHLLGDMARLRQVLLNLLSNAVKFTPADGDIVLFVKPADGVPRRGGDAESGPNPDAAAAGVESTAVGAAEAHPENAAAAGEDPGIREEGDDAGSLASGEVLLDFTVLDTGIGISPEQQEAIFEPFRQEDPAITRRFGGTGLGLAISRRLVALMGGALQLQSEPGQGATFFFSLPFQLQARPDGPALATHPELQRTRVLVVDDNKASQLTLMEALKRFGCQEIACVDGGEAGLARLREAAAAGTPFGLVLLDWHMPGMAGFEVAQAIRQEYDHLPIVVVTSDRRKPDPAMRRQLGVTEALTKPIPRKILFRAALEALGQRQGAQGRQQAVEEKPAARSLRILLAEDTGDNVLLLQAYLKRSGHQMDVAVDGAQAVARFKESHYDLVLMDMQMPVLDGFKATAQIRRWEEQQGRSPCPIIALTAYAMEEDRERCLSAGCTEHLAKPLRKPVLLAALDRVGRCGKAHRASPLAFGGQGDAAFQA